MNTTINDNNNDNNNYNNPKNHEIITNGLKRKFDEKEEDVLAPSKKAHEIPKVHVIWDYEQVSIPYNVKPLSIVSKLRKEISLRGTFGSACIVSSIGKVQGHFRQVFQDMGFRLAEVKASKPLAIDCWILTELLGIVLREGERKFVLIFITNERDGYARSLTEICDSGSHVIYISDHDSLTLKVYGIESIGMKEFTKDLEDLLPNPTISDRQLTFSPSDKQIAPKKDRRDKSTPSEETLSNLFAVFNSLRNDGFLPRENVIRTYAKRQFVKDSGFSSLLSQINSVCNVEGTAPNRMIWPRKIDEKSEKWNGIDVNYPSAYERDEIEIAKSKIFIESNQVLKHQLSLHPRSNQISYLRFVIYDLLKSNVMSLPDYLAAKNPAQLTTHLHNAHLKYSKK